MHVVTLNSYERKMEREKERIMIKRDRIEGEKEKKSAHGVE